ncbi:MAG: hypothetical protein M1816_005425 [Peltula sp. TS41687]|nr:MAG: hypothetical protein M1816_005425 [Peltula sp. TS41687]
MAGTCAVAGNPFAASSLVDYMEASLPADVEAGTALLQTPSEAIALICHACMLAVGFRLVGLGEDHRLEAASETDEAKPLPREWNASSSSSSYAFRYVHPQSSMEYLIKVTRLGPKVVVFGMGIGDDKTNSFDVAVRDYILESSLPYQRPEDAGAERTKMQLQELFLSPGRIADLAALFKVKIIQRVIPGLQKLGYDETAPSSSSSSATATAATGGGGGGGEGESAAARQPEPLYRGPPPRPIPIERFDPLAARRPLPVGDFAPPGFEDEYELNRPRPRRQLGPLPPPVHGGRNPLDIGHDDLYPAGLGPHDPLRGTFMPGLPRHGGGGGGGGGGGMHPTFDDPLFGGRQGGDVEGWYDSRRPPGARYDPIGPGDEPPSGLRDGPRFPGGGGGGGGPQGGTGGPPNPFGDFGGGAFI